MCSGDRMNLTINGESRTFAAETLNMLVEQLAMRPDRVAIELNRQIVPRDRWAQTRLKDGDQLEIVHFVGGGLGYHPPSGAHPSIRILSSKIVNRKIVALNIVGHRRQST
jgi:thiamine biosynthesis protein ThiS